MHAALALLSASFHSLAAVSLGALVLALLLHLGKVAAEARSWHAIVRHAHPDTPVRFGTSLGAFTGAIGANAFLPARVGETLRLGIVRRRIPGSSLATITSTIVLETVIELVFGLCVIVVVLLAGRSLGAIGTPLGIVNALAGRPLLLGGLCAGLLGLSMLALRFRTCVRHLAGELGQGFAILRAPRRLVQGVLGWKLVAWGLRLATIYCFLVAFHLGAGLWTVLLVIATQNLAALMPISPGNAGTQQAAFAVTLAGTASASAILGFGVGMQVATTVVDVAAGAAAIALLASRSDVRTALCLPRRAPALARPL